MDKMSEELIKKIEKVLNIKFKEWQHKYLLNQPMLLDMKMTGRCTGKTLVYIIKKLFENSESLRLKSRKEVLKIADWWCCEISEERALNNSYLDYYKYQLIDVYKTINNAGIITRKVIF